MRRPLIFAAAALAVAAGVYALWPRAGSPEEQVRTAVRDMEQGLGTRDAAKVLEHVSEAFHSPTLGDRTDVQRLVLGEVLRGGGVRVVTLQADVLPEVDGRWRWRGRVAAARAGGAGIAAITDAELRQFHVDALFALEHGQYRVVEATVTPVESSAREGG
jgi:hypothetical protein